MDEYIEFKRIINERKFGTWEELFDVGRRYFIKVEGHHGWEACYTKTIDMKIEDKIVFMTNSQVYSSRKK